MAKGKGAKHSDPYIFPLQRKGGMCNACVKYLCREKCEGFGTIKFNMSGCRLQYLIYIFGGLLRGQTGSFCLSPLIPNSLRWTPTGKMTEGNPVIW